MADAAHKSCITRGCSGITNRGKWCQKCEQQGKGKIERAGKTRYKKKTKEENAFYKSKPWRSTRLEVLAANPFCVCRADYCDHPKPCDLLASVVDHETPRSEGGSDDANSGNLRSMCKKCHDKKSANEDSKGARSATQVILICGPSGSGKSTYVRNRARQGDLILDFDQIMSAICKYPFHRKPEHLLKFGFDARDALIRRLELGVPALKRAWIIESAPKAERRNKFRSRLKAKVIVLETPASTCLERIYADPKRDTTFDWSEIVNAWHNEYVPHSEDIRINGEDESRNTNTNDEALSSSS